MKIVYDDGTEVELPKAPTITRSHEGWLRVEGEPGNYNPEDDGYRAESLLQEAAWRIALAHEIMSTEKSGFVHANTCRNDKFYRALGSSGRYECHGECTGTTFTDGRTNRYELYKVRQAIADPTMWEREEWVEIEESILAQLKIQNVHVLPFEPVLATFWNKTKTRESKKFRNALFDSVVASVYPDADKS